MKLDELDKQLKSYYRKQKLEDANLVPAFDSVFPNTIQKEPSHAKSWVLKIAAAIIILLGMTYGIYRDGNDPKTIPDQLVNTQELLPHPEYIWNWESPTKSLLDDSKKVTQMETDKWN